MRPDDLRMSQCERRDINGPIDVKRREDAQRAPHIESFERYPSCSFTLPNKQTGDEKSADDEERENAEASWYSGVARVVEHDDGSAHRTEEV